MLVRIISGFQTGVDRGAILAADMLGLLTGGWIANGWIDETGCVREEAERYGLRECVRQGWAARTEMNVRDSDATVIINNERKLTGGSYMTANVCESLERPLWIVRAYQVPTREVSQYTLAFENWLPTGSRMSFKAWCQVHGIRTLNVAGPRASKWARGEEAAAEWLAAAVGSLEDEAGGADSVRAM